jgi:hypothetical protein
MMLGGMKRSETELNRLPSTSIAVHSFCLGAAKLAAGAFLVNKRSRGCVMRSGERKHACLSFARWYVLSK